MSPSSGSRSNYAALTSSWGTKLRPGRLILCHSVPPVYVFSFPFLKCTVHIPISQFSLTKVFTAAGSYSSFRFLPQALWCIGKGTHGKENEYFPLQWLFISISLEAFAEKQDYFLKIWSIKYSLHLCVKTQVEEKWYWLHAWPFLREIKNYVPWLFLAFPHLFRQ